MPVSVIGGKCDCGNMDSVGIMLECECGKTNCWACAIQNENDENIYCCNCGKVL